MKRRSRIVFVNADVPTAAQSACRMNVRRVVLLRWGYLPWELIDGSGKGWLFLDGVLG